MRTIFVKRNAIVTLMVLILAITFGLFMQWNSTNDGGVRLLSVAPLHAAAEAPALLVANGTAILV